MVPVPVPGKAFCRIARHDAATCVERNVGRGPRDGGIDSGFQRGFNGKDMRRSNSIFLFTHAIRAHR